MLENPVAAFDVRYNNMYIRMYACMDVHVYVFMHACICVCTRKCVYVGMLI